VGSESWSSADASQAADGKSIAVGVGVHAGETVATDVGSVVNIAARVCAQAAAGELLVTDAVRSLTRTYLDVTFLPRGRKRLKGSSEPVGIYRVTPPTAGARAPGARLFAGKRRQVAGAALAIPLVVLVSAVVGGALIRESLGGFGGSTPLSTSSIVGEASASSAPSAGAETAFPSAAENKLLQLIPEHDRERCQRANPEERPIGALFRNPGGTPFRYLTSVEAGIECDLGGISAPDHLWFWKVLPGSFDASNAATALYAHAGLAHATPGTCREEAERPAVETWSFGGGSGKLVCYESTTGDAVVLWIYDDSQLFGKALRDDRDMAALLDWWEKVGRFAPP
jgi:hypothetical protein